MYESTSPRVRELAVFREVAVEGRSPRQVAARWQISIGEVRQMVRSAERQLARVQTEADPLFCRAVQVRRLEHQWQEAMSAWYRSQEPEEVVRFRCDAAGNILSVEKARRPRTGDVRFLQQAERLMQALEKMRQQWAAAAPPAETLSAADRLAALEKLFQQASLRRLGEDGYLYN